MGFGYHNILFLATIFNLCADVIKYCYEKQYTTTDLSEKLISVLEDYKKQCVLCRLNYVTVLMEEKTAERGEDDRLSILVLKEKHQLGKKFFENQQYNLYLVSRDHEQGIACLRSYYCQDNWDNWNIKHNVPFEDIVKYRIGLIQLYENAFDKIIQRVKDILKTILTKNNKKNYVKKEKEFSKALSTKIVPGFLGFSETEYEIK